MVEPVRLPDGRVLCPYCNTVYSNWGTYKIHSDTVHQAEPEYFQCRICSMTIKHKVYFRKHITTKHFKGGKDLIKNYALSVPKP
jgi:uncharacterized C2H2 Zn-finger protein